MAIDFSKVGKVAGNVKHKVARITPLRGKKDYIAAEEQAECTCGQCAGEESVAAASEGAEEEKAKAFKVPFFGKKEKADLEEETPAVEEAVEQPVCEEESEAKAERKLPFFGKKTAQPAAIQDEEEEQPNVEETVLEARPAEKKIPFFGKKSQEEVVEEPAVSEPVSQPEADTEPEADAAEKGMVLKRPRGTSEIALGAALAAAGLPLLLVPPVGVIALVGGGALAAKGYLDFTNKKDFSPEAKQLAQEAKAFASDTLVPAGKQVAAGAKEFAKNDLVPATKRAAAGAKKVAAEKIVPTASNLAGAAVKKAKDAASKKEDSAQ